MHHLKLCAKYASAFYVLFVIGFFTLTAFMRPEILHITWQNLLMLFYGGFVIIPLSTIYIGAATTEELTFGGNLLKSGIIILFFITLSGLMGMIISPFLQFSLLPGTNEFAVRNISTWSSGTAYTAFLHLGVLHFPTKHRPTFFDAT